MIDKITYLKYIISDRWKEVRRRKLDNNPECEHCLKIFVGMDRRRATQVHHLNYNNIGNESDEDLMAVCNYCHILLEIKKINEAEYNKIVEKILHNESERELNWIRQQKEESDEAACDNCAEYPIKKEDSISVSVDVNGTTRFIYFCSNKCFEEGKKDICNEYHLSTKEEIEQAELKWKK